MKLLYGTGNQAKLAVMRKRLAALDIELIGLKDLKAEEKKIPEVAENGSTPLENARLKAFAYYEAFQMPVFSCDSGLYFDNVPDEIQPGVHVRNVNGKCLSDEEMVTYYTGLAKQYGNLMAEYRNAICFVMDKEHIYETMEPSIYSEKFMITDKSHSAIREKGFPLDSISIDSETGKYYYDCEQEELEQFAVEDGFLSFFERFCIEAVITSYNQGSMLLEAVQSICSQTLLPRRIIVVDDGSTDEVSLAVLERIQNDSDLPVPVTVFFQENQGVSAARNVGIKQTRSSLVLVLDGDDRLEPEYVEKVSQLLYENPDMVIASSWMRTFGVLDALVCPTGGDMLPFLSHNCCPATHILRRECYEQCSGYDEAMRFGFEDWDFFLSMLETSPKTHIGIVEEPLLAYRTAPASANIRSMKKRLELMRYIIEKHKDSYSAHVTDVLLDMEAISDTRLFQWENEILHTMEKQQELSETAKNFIQSPSYGDGGMAAAVRIVSVDNWQDREKE